MSPDQLTSTELLNSAPAGDRTGMASLALGSGAFLVLGSLATLPYLVLLALPLGVAAVVSGVRALRRGVVATSGRVASVAGITLGSLGVLGWVGLMVLWYLLAQTVNR
ncbi:hypothetical protein WKI68_03720 [Streptomyces sp. MS1.HAVA.3]|uniref:DUF4190 domain-containing protein n=1 Tax=Streptomyces caledonius TaxID=3134107 RepID=A0ABU8TYU7_9ACTN